MPKHCVAAHRSRIAGRVLALLGAVLAAVVGAGPTVVLAAAPAAAAQRPLVTAAQRPVVAAAQRPLVTAVQPTAQPAVRSAEVLVLWDGSRETLAVRWHLSAPAKQVHWLVAAPAAVRAEQVGAGLLRTVADAALPRNRWIVTHPWLLADDTGRRARDHLAAGVTPTDGPGAELTASSATTVSEVLASAATAGVPVDATTRDWARQAQAGGAQVRHLTVTASRPTTVFGPVAISFDATSPLVPASAWPRPRQVTLLTVAPQVLAPVQPDLATSAAESAGPVFTVENARGLPADVSGLDGLSAPPAGRVVTALTGRMPATTPAALQPQSGPVADWRTEVGVWWPGWGAAAVAVLAAVTVVALATVATRRRNRREAAGPARAASSADLSLADLTATEPPVAVRTGSAPPDTLPDGLSG